MTDIKRSPGRFHASMRILLSVLSIVYGIALQAASARAQTLTAAWTQQKFDFTVLGFQSRYSCFALTDYIRRILLELGARKDDLLVGQVGCGFGTPPSVRANFWQLRPLSPDAPRRASSVVQRVQAHWQEVRVTFGDPVLGGPDLSGCELAHQAIGRILPYFVVHNARFDPQCREHSSTPGPYVLRADVLLPGAADRATAEPALVRRFS